METIVCIGGGSGGHLNPAISVLTDILETNSKSGKIIKCYLITDPRCVEYIKSLPPEIEVYILKIIKTPTKIWEWPKVIFNYIKCLGEVLWYLRSIKPSMIIGFGSYVSFFSIIAARLLGITTIAHEQNIIPSKTTKVLKNFVDHIAVSFEITKSILNNKISYNDLNNPAFKYDKYESFCKIKKTNNFFHLLFAKKLNIVYTGNPIKSTLILTKEKTFSSNLEFKILIFGGSQGAKILDDLCPSIMYSIEKIFKTKYPNFTLHVSHQAHNMDHVKNKYEELNLSCRVSNYFMDMNKEYDEADLVISRSGASTIFELIQKAQPSILIPYPLSYKDHQLHHARYLNEMKCGWLIEQKDFEQSLQDKIIELIENRELLLEYSKNLIKLQCNWNQKMLDLIL